MRTEVRRRLPHLSEGWTRSLVQTSHWRTAEGCAIAQAMRDGEAAAFAAPLQQADHAGAIRAANRSQPPGLCTTSAR